MQYKTQNTDIKIFKFSLKLTMLILTLFLAAFSSFSQSSKGSISGIVKDTTGAPVPMTSVSLKGTEIGTSADSKGTFTLKNIPEGNQTIIFQMFGYNSVEKEVTVKPGENTTIGNIVLKENTLSLEDVAINVGNKYTKTESEYVSKLPLKNMENSQVYTTVTKELIKDQMVFTVDDALKNVPGLQKMWEATGRSGDGGAFFNSRGFIVQSQLRNGIAGNVSSRIDAANIERIEMIKGPSATLFGSPLTSYGGLINRVTKKPYDRLGGEVGYAGGSYSFNRIHADVNTPIDSAKNILFRLNTAYSYEGSFQDNGFEKTFVVAPSLTYKVNDRLSFSLDAEIFNGSNSSKQFLFFYFPAAQLGATRADQLDIDYKRSYSSNDIYQTSRNANVFGQMTYKLSENWTSQTNITRTSSNSDGPVAYFYFIPNSVVTGNPAATGSNYLARAVQATANSYMNVTEIQQNFMGKFNIGTVKNRFLAGLDYFHQNSNQLFYGANFDTIPSNGNIPAYSNFGKDNLNKTLQNGYWTWPSEFVTSTYSAYVSDVINITDYFIVSGALRLDHFDNKGNFSEATGQYSGAYKQTVLSPKLGVVFQPVQDVVSLFANYQNGFTNKTGTTDYLGRTFKPEQANQLEGGVKLDAFHGKLSSTISYYRINVKDVVRAYTGPTALPNQTIQDGTQLSRGVEVEVIASPVNGLNLIAGFAYNESILEKADADVEGRRPATAMSPYTANFWASYKLQQGILKGFGLGFGGNYASDNKILNSNYYGEFILPAYTVLNSTVFYENTKYRVGLKMDNMTNQKYWIGYTTMNPQKLRSIIGSITFKF